MRPALRLVFIGAFVGATAFGAALTAAAQNTDEAHAQCAQGGGPAFFSGAGEPNTRGIGRSTARIAHFGAVDVTAQADDDEGAGASGGAGGAGGGDGGGPASGESLSDFAHRAARSENEAGAGGGGAAGGLGGSTLGGGAGGCDELPRRLPVTGSDTTHVAYMGAAFIVVGVLLLAGKRRWEISTD